MLKGFLGENNKKNIFIKIEYSNLQPKSSKPAQLYETPKIY